MIRANQSTGFSDRTDLADNILQDCRLDEGDAALGPEVRADSAEGILCRECRNIA
jgi:hypothetical protein